MEQYNEYGFPAVYPADVLNDMRSLLKLSQDQFHQLHLCFDAASNLYARISLEKLYELCCHYLSPISQEDFLDAAEVISHESRNHYAIIRNEIFHEDMLPGGPMDRELVAEHLYALDDKYYYEIEKKQVGKPWYIPVWTEFAKYSDEFYIEDTPQLCLMTNYLQNTQRKLRCPPTEIVSEFSSLLRSDYDFQNIIDEGQRLGVRFQDQMDFRNFLALLLQLSHHTRRYIHRGHTPAELELPTQSVDELLQLVTYDNNYISTMEKIGHLLRSKFDTPSTVSGKPSRNAPCPCGSGRKYKNCCGK